MTTCTLNPIVILYVGVLLSVHMIKVSFDPNNGNNNKNNNNNNNNNSNDEDDDDDDKK